MNMHMFLYYNFYITVLVLADSSVCEVLQTGLNLLITNTSSDQSVVDDGISSSLEDKRAKSEVNTNVKKKRKKVLSL